MYVKIIKNNNYFWLKLILAINFDIWLSIINKYNSFDMH